MGRELLVLLLLLSVCFAWDGVTHRALARELGEHLGCDESIMSGSTAPDLVFHDTVRHHCYLDECPAMEEAREWNGSCYNIGVASHYFFDAKNHWHQISGENMNQHSYWETRVGKAYAPGFEYCKYDVCVDWYDFEKWKAEFNQFLGEPVECLSDRECDWKCQRGKCIEPNLLEILINFFAKIIAW